MQAQFRQRLLDRFRQDFAAFRDSLGPGQRTQWDAIVSSGFATSRRSFFGYYPARKASRLDPIEALRQQ